MQGKSHNPFLFDKKESLLGQTLLDTYSTKPYVINTHFLINEWRNHEIAQTVADPCPDDFVCV